MGVQAHNHVYETVPFYHWGTKIVPLRVPYYGQPNNAPRGTVSVPFFLRVSQLILVLSGQGPHHACWAGLIFV